MTITTLRKKLDTHELTAVEALSFYMERIASLDCKLGAYLHINLEQSIQCAKEAQKLIDAGKSTTLTGIPIGLKDNLCTTDMPTTCASYMLQGYTPPYDATVVKKLRTQGAVLTGKLNMDEFAMGATTQTSYCKKTFNPFDSNYVPGGSSGGSAAAVSAMLCAGALGSDTGGSIRQPASFCGVTGLRPTYGLVSRYGCVAFASSLDQVGPVAQSAQDCALILDAISGRDEYDQTTHIAPPVSTLSQMGTSVKGKKLGIISELMGEQIDTDVRQSIEQAASFYRDAGAIVEYVNLPLLTHAVPAYYLISSAEASANLSRYDGIRYGRRSENARNYEDIISKSRGEGFGREVKRRILLGNYALCSGYYDAYYKRAVHLADIVKEEYRQIFLQYDALLSPVSPTAAFKYNELPSDPAKMYLADICTVSASLAQLPSLSTPCGYTESGLPIGLMITGKRFDDAFILALADLHEQSFARRIPEVL